MNALKTNRVDVVFITAADMPKPDPETHLIVDALKDKGVRADVISWESAMDWEKVPLVVIRTAWDYFKRLPEFLAWARHVDEVTRLFNPYTVVEWNCHKRYLQVLSQKGIPTVPTILLEQGTVMDSTQTLFDSGWNKVVIKPAISIGAIGAMHGSTSEKSLAHHLDSLISKGDVLVQPFVSSVSTSGEVSIIYFDGEFSHAIRKLPKEGEYRVQDHHGGTVHPHDPAKEEYDVCSAALDAVPKATMYARVDLVAYNGSPAIMELELIEPALFLSSSSDGTKRFVEKLCKALESKS